MTSLSAFGQGRLYWQVCMAESIKSELFTGECCVTVTSVREQAEGLTLHKPPMSSSFKELQRLAVSCTCERRRGFGCFKASEENKNNEECKKILNSYWFWNKIAQNQGTISWNDRKVMILSLRRTDAGGTQRGCELYSFSGIACSQQMHDFGIEHVYICKFKGLKTISQNNYKIYHLMVNLHGKSHSRIKLLDFMCDPPMNKWNLLCEAGGLSDRSFLFPLVFSHN